jgi:hypothetical protein
MYAKSRIWNSGAISRLGMKIHGDSQLKSAR